MKIKSQKIIGQNGKVREYFINEFNSNGLIERTKYIDKKGKIEFYSKFEYDLNGNCISKKEFDANDNLTVSYEWEFDSQNREIKSIELNSENLIWKWHEKQYPNDNTIIHLSKDKNGIIDHRTVENIETGMQERFDSNGKLYSKIFKEFDTNGKLINSKTQNAKGKVTEENKYRFIGLTEIWELYIDGEFIKTEEYQNDNNGNQIYYIRKDNKGKSLEWLKREYDEFGNQITIENGLEINKTTHRTTIEIEYLKNNNAC